MSKGQNHSKLSYRVATKTKISPVYDYGLKRTVSKIGGGHRSWGSSHKLAKNAIYNYIYY